MPPIFSPKPTPPLVLSFAASDPTGGAGIQADLLTLASLGCHPLSVITALTVQDTAGVDEILVIDSEWVMDQARMLLEDVPVAAFKLGMLGSPESMAIIAEILADYPDIPVVLDPILSMGIICYYCRRRCPSVRVTRTYTCISYIVRAKCN